MNLSRGLDSPWWYSFPNPWHSSFSLTLLDTLLCLQQQRIDHLFNNRHQQTATATKTYTLTTTDRMGSSSSKGAAAKITAHDRAILDLKVQRDKLRQYNKRVRHKRLFSPFQLGFLALSLMLIIFLTSLLFPFVGNQLNSLKAL